MSPPGSQSDGGAIPALSAALLVEAAMYSVLTPMLPGLTARLMLSTVQAGVLFGSYVAAFVVGALIGWRRVPRAGIRGATRAALLVFAVANLGFALAGSFWLAAAFRFVAGAAGGLTWVAILTWLMAARGVDGRGRAIGAAFSVAVVGTLLGPIIGNVALVIGLLPVFGAVAAVSVVAAALLPPAPPAPVAFGGGDLARQAGRMTALVAACSATVGVSLAYGALFVLLPLRLSGAGVRAESIGWLFATSALLAAVVNRAAGSAADRFGTRPLSLFSLFGTAVCLVVLALNESVAAAAISVVVGLGLVLAAGVTPSSAAVSLEAELMHVRPVTVSVLVLAVYSGGEAVGSFIAPAVAQHFSVGSALILVAVVNIGAAALLLTHRRSLP